MVQPCRGARAEHRHALVRLGRIDAGRGLGRELRMACRSCSIRSGQGRRRSGPTQPGGFSTRSRCRSCAGTPVRSRRSSGSRPRCAASSRSAPGPSRRCSRSRPRRSLGLVVSVTGPVDHVSDGERTVAISNGDPMMARITGTGCMSSAITGCFLAVAGSAFDAAVDALVAFGVAGEDAASGCQGPRKLPREPLRRARGARSGDPRREGSGRVRVHAIVGRSGDRPAGGRGGRDGDPAARQRADGRGGRARRRVSGAPGDVRRQRRCRGGARARRPTACISGRRTPAPSWRGAPGCCSGGRPPASRRRSAPTPTTSGSGPVWETPSKADAAPALGLAELGRICSAVARARDRDRRDRRVERRRVHPGRSRGSGRRPCGDRSGARAGGR